jgi:hypothetical protein
MKKKITRIILTIIIPFVVYYGFTAIGIFSKSQMPGDQNVPNVLEGIGVTIIAALGLALIGVCLWGCWNIAGHIVDGISYKLRYRREQQQYDDWPESPATTVPSPPVDEDQAYLQRIGVGEEEEEYTHQALEDL